MRVKDVSAGHPGVPGEAERELRRLRERVAELERERDILRDALRSACACLWEASKGAKSKEVWEGEFIRMALDNLSLGLLPEQRGEGTE